MKRFVLTLSILLILNAVASACPNCKGLEPVVPGANDAQAGSLPNGFNSSIYFMLGGLFLVISSIATLIVKAIRDTNKAREVAPQHT
jgi:hypothetical protein